RPGRHDRHARSRPGTRTGPGIRLPGDRGQLGGRLHRRRRDHPGGGAGKRGRRLVRAAGPDRPPGRRLSRDAAELALTWGGNDAARIVSRRAALHTRHAARRRTFRQTQGLRSIMANGTVKWFNDAKGFGFISPEDGSADVFAHFSAINAKGFRSLKEGQRVSYEVTQGPKGAQASNIVPLD